MSRVDNPYVGPRAFRPDETLYGRDDESRALLDLLIAERIVLLYSPSGAGKTSLIQAKVIAQMRAEDYQVLPIVRPGAEVDIGEWREVGNPFVARIVAACEDGKPEDEAPLPKVAGITLASYLSQRSWIRGDPRLKLLILDQFEEVLTSEQNDEDKVAFFRQLGEALRNPQIWALFAMREEYSAALDSYRHLLPTRLASHFRLELLGLQAAERAIRKPAESVGVEFDAAAAELLVEELATVRERTCDGAIVERHLTIVEPLYLQIVCHQLWEKAVSPDVRRITAEHLGLDAVSRAGGGGVVEQALEGYYATVVRAVAGQDGVAERRIREWFGRELVTSRGLRRQVSRGQHETAGLANELVEALVQRLLLRSDSRSGTLWYEIAHDRLVEMIVAGNARWFDQNLASFQLRAVRWDLLRRTGATMAADGVLLNGRDLNKTKAWRKQQPDAHTSAVDEEFLRASRLAWNAGSWKRWAGLGAAGVIVLLVVAGALWVQALRTHNEELTRQTAQVRAGTLLAAAASEKWRGHDHELASLLAIQAYRLTVREPYEPDGGLGDRIEENLRGALRAQPFSFGTTGIAASATTRVEEEETRIWLSGQTGVVALREEPRLLVLRSFTAGPHDLKTIAVADDIIGAAFASGDHRLAVLTRSGLEVHALPAGSVTAEGDGPLRVPTDSPPSGPFCLSLNVSVAAIVVASGHVVEVWRLLPGTPVMIARLSPPTLPAGTVITALGCDATGEVLAWGGESGDVGLVSLAQAEATSLRVWSNRFNDWPQSLQKILERRSSGMDLAVTALHYLPNAQQLVAIYRQGPPRLFDLRADGSPPDAHYLLPTWRSAIALEIAQDRGRATRNIVSLARYLSADASADERWIAVGGARGEIGLWDLKSLTTEIGEGAKPDGTPEGAVYAAYEEIAGFDGNVRAIRWASPAVRPTDTAGASSASVDERWVMAANAGGDLRWWSLAGLPGVGYRSYQTGTEPAVVYALAFVASPTDGKGPFRLAFGGFLNAGVLRIAPLDLTVTNDPSLRIPPKVRALATDADRDRLLIATGDVESGEWARPPCPQWPQCPKSYYSWLLDLTKGAQEKGAQKKAVPLPGDHHDDGQWAAVINAQGNLLLTAGYDGVAIIWRQSKRIDMEWEAETLPDSFPKDQRSAIYSAALGAGDRDLVLGTLDGKVRLWREKSARFVQQELLLDAKVPIRSLAYSPDGKRLVAGDENGLLRVWSIRDGHYKQEKAVSAHKGTIYTASFSGDGRLLTGGGDGRVYVWSEVDGRFDRKLRLGLEGPRAEVVSVVFEPTANLVAASDADGYVHLWTLGMPGLVEKACAALGRNLSGKESCLSGCHRFAMICGNGILAHAIV
jgi:WD40 repeat protein